MSHSHEPSYYEIALTNRQVLVVFVVLLVCVVAAFFSGVWIGRQNEQTRIAEIPESSIDEAAPTQDNGDAKVLNFFSDEGAEDKPSLAEVVEQQPTETTLAEDVGVSEVEDPASEVQELVVEEATTGTGTEEETVKPEPTVANAENRTASQPTASQAEKSTADGEHVIQVFSSADEAQAKKLTAQLSSGGFPAFLSPVDVDGQTMYRVRIGPYSDLSDAESVAARVRRSYKLDTWVTR